MATIQVTLPDNLKEFLAEQTSARGYKTESDYVCDLLREAEKRQATAAVEMLLIESLDSGSPVEATQDYWDAKYRKAAERSRVKEG